MSFKPTLYLEKGDPFSTKIAVLVADAGLSDKFIWDAATPANANKIASIMAKPAAFPAMEFAKDDYLMDSSAIIDKICADFGVDKTKLKVFDFYAVQEPCVHSTYQKLVTINTELCEGGMPELFQKLSTK